MFDRHKLIRGGSQGAGRRVEGAGGGWSVRVRCAEGAGEAARRGRAGGRARTCEMANALRLTSRRRRRVTPLGRVEDRLISARGANERSEPLAGRSVIRMQAIGCEMNK